MSKVLIDRALLERVQERLDPHRDAVLWGAVCDTFHTAPSGTPAMPVKAYYHESGNLEGVRTRSVGLEVRKEFADAPLVLESDALAQIACLEGEIAKRDARIMGLESQYQRDVFGLNNEGDPIGGDPAGGYANDNARLRAELAAIKAQEPIGWYTEDHLDDKSATTYSWTVAERWVEKGWPVSPLYAAPVSEAKAQGVVMPAELDRAFTTGESCDGVYRVVIQSETLKEMQAVHRWITGLSAAPAQQVSVPDGWRELAKRADDFLYSLPETAGVLRLRADLCTMLSAPAAPAADAGLVEALDYQALFDAIAAATSVYANGAVNISVQAFRDALAARRSTGVV